jgi:hypothetical protein
MKPETRIELAERLERQSRRDYEGAARQVREWTAAREDFRKIWETRRDEVAKIRATIER